MLRLLVLEGNTAAGRQRIADTAGATPAESYAAELRFGRGLFWGVQHHPEYRLHDIAAVIRRYGQILVDEVSLSTRPH
jgi:hypothetical protein